MNTEPPEGDDLQRMLVSMKQHVLEHATPHRRRRFRPGIALGIVGLLAIGTATGAVALTLSQQDDQPVTAPTQTQQPAPAPSATTPTSAPITEKPTPRPAVTPSATPTATSEAAVRIPGDCYLIVPDADYSRFFGAARHESTIWTDTATREPDGNDRINGLVDPDESLHCTWQNEGVVANMSVTIRQATSEGSRQVTEAVNESGPTCVDRLGGRVCSYRPGTDSGDDIVGTFFVRGNLTIEIMQTDFPTDNLLGAIIGKIWGD
jgi:hypothetical protein